MPGEPLSLSSPFPFSSAATAAPLPRAAIEPVYDRCAPALHRFFMVRTGRNAELSADLMQQLWLAALRSASGVPADELEFWLRSVAKNLLASHWRRSASKPPPDRNPVLARRLAERLEDPSPPDALLADAESHHQLLLALTDLPADDQDLLIAHYVRQVPQAALAQSLGVSSRAIEGRLYRARQALKERLSAG